MFTPHSSGFGGVGMSVGLSSNSGPMLGSFPQQQQHHHHVGQPGVVRALPGALVPKSEDFPMPHQQQPVPHGVDRSKQVEDALAILQYEASFSDQTMQVLRQAVAQGRAQAGANRPPLQISLSSPAGAPSRFGHRSVKPASSKRQQLTVEEAAEIYAMRPRAGGDNKKGSMVHCRVIAPKYGVTPKTIRDVWSGRTWAEATRHLWTPEEIAQRSERDKDQKDGVGQAGGGFDPGDDAHVHFQHAMQPGMEAERATPDLSHGVGDMLMPGGGQDGGPAGASASGGGVDNMQEQLLRYHLNLQMPGPSTSHSQQQPSAPYQYQVPNAQTQSQQQQQQILVHPMQPGQGPQAMVLNNVAFGALQQTEQSTSQFQQPQQLILQDQLLRFSPGQGMSQGRMK